MSLSDQRDALVGRTALWVAAACGILVAATVLTLSMPAFSSRLRGERSVRAYAAGDRIELDPTTFGRASHTVFLFSRFSCGACEASKPVIAEIVTDLVKHPDAQVVLVTSDAAPEEERLFALELGIPPSQIYQTNLQRLRLRQVPTLVLADSTGRILMAREGRITPSDRIDVARTLSSPIAQP